MHLIEKESAIKRFLLHIHPPKIDERALAFNKTFGLGGIAALLFVLLAVTGVLLRFTYVPTPEKAYNSILYLQQQLLFGRLLRNIHYFSSLLLLIVSFLHLLRVYYSQSIYEQRAKNWIYGLLLFFLVVFSNFTGYLLPWDQLAYWAVSVVTNLVEYIPLLGKPLASFLKGGNVVDETTLLNFYNLHTGVLPVLFIFLVSIHFWLVRKAKGIYLPQSSESKKVNTVSSLVNIEIMVALIVLVVVFLLSIFIDAPLQDKASITVSPNPSKAPWYFMGVQELLMHVHPVIAGFILPTLLLFFFFKLPYVKYQKINMGTYFSSSNGKKANLITAIAILLFTWFIIIANENWLHFNLWMPNAPVFIVSGVIPLLLYMLPVSGILYAIKAKFSLGKQEMLMCIFTTIISAYVAMLIIGQWFRGESMHLILF